MPQKFDKVENEKKMMAILLGEFWGKKLAKNIYTNKINIKITSNIQYDDFIPKGKTFGDKRSKLVFLIFFFGFFHYRFKKMSSVSTHWMQSLILHPMSTHSTCIWVVPHRKSWKYMKNVFLERNTFFHLFSFFWLWVYSNVYRGTHLLDAELIFFIQRVPTLNIWVKL